MQNGIKILTVSLIHRVQIQIQKYSFAGSFPKLLSFSKQRATPNSREYTCLLTGAPGGASTATNPANLGASLEICRNMAEASTGPKYTNRLSKEKSPYLLQHAHNPVDWYPWGEEALEKAKKENKMIFLSVGYSTCHWCHVMERESFENPDIGKIMNDNFVNIKVDREERPDVDKVYMTFVQAISGGGGWPMSVFLSPDLKPITGGTYFPPTDKWGRPGFPTILKYISSQWEDKKEEVEKQGRMFMEAMQKMTLEEGGADEVLSSDAVTNKCFTQLNKPFDPRYGGIGKEPKFPQPGTDIDVEVLSNLKQILANFDFLLRYHHHNRNEESGQKALGIVEKTLVCMERGGIHDFVSQGFHRYSTDQKWHIPHFEKMLYDQAQLAVLYAETYQVTRKELYADTLRDILSYVNRDLSHPEGGFYSAEDADSYATEQSAEKREGAFCVWGYDEICRLLAAPVRHTHPNGPTMAELICRHFQVKDGGNIAPFSDPHGELKEKNVFITENTVAETGNHFGLDEKETRDILEKSRQILFEHRAKRPKPHLDSKIITSWNGLMISGFAKAGTVLGGEAYLSRAEKAALFVRKHLTSPDDRSELLRSCYTKDTQTGGVLQISPPIKGFLDDYMFLIAALLDLFEATQEVDWLKWAQELQTKADELFWDNSEENKGYFMSRGNDKYILVRMKEDQDGAEPSGNSMATLNLLRLSSLLDKKEYEEKAKNILKGFNERLESIPMVLPKMVSSYWWIKNPPIQIVICGPRGFPATTSLLRVVHNMYLPEHILIFLDLKNQDDWLENQVGLLKNMQMQDGKPTAYVCKNFSCSLPVTTADELKNQLQQSA